MIFGMVSITILSDVYQRRIGPATTDDEVYGYWLFVVGIVLGAVGLVLFYAAPARSTPREFGYVLGAVGVIALFIGPTIRLPLSRAALSVSYAGAFVCLLGTLWFTVVYPAGWTGPEGDPAVTLYVGGLALAAVGAVVAPLLTGRNVAYERAQAAAEEAGTAADRASAERDGLAADLVTSESSREELSELLSATAGELDAAQAAIAAAMDSKATFELYADRGGKWRWRLRHRNSNVIADSAQGYSSRQKAMQGLRSVQTNAAGGAVVLLEDATEDDTDEDVPEVPAPESQATVEVYEDAGGEFRWRLRHDNGNVLADGSEGYASKSNVRRALERLRAYVPGAPYLRVDPVAFEVYADRAGQYRWRLLHRNGEILGDGGGYDTRAAARRAAESVQSLAPDATVDDGFEVYEDAGEEFRWRLSDEDGIVADSGEGYTERNKAVRAVERVQNYAAGADLLTIGSAAFEIYEGADGAWRWRLRHRNGNILADGGQGFPKRSAAVASIERVKRHAPGARRSK